MSEQNAAESAEIKSKMPVSAWIVIVFLVAVVAGLMVWKNGGNNQPVVSEEKKAAPVTAEQPSAAVSAPVVTPTAPAASATAETGVNADKKTAQAPIDFDTELKGLDKETNSVSENNFSENDLSDANLGI